MPALAVLAAVLLLLSGCAARSGPSAAEPVPAPSTTSAPTTHQEIARVSYATICPDLLAHGTASADLVSEFVNDPQAMANQHTATTARFDTVIEDLEFDIAAAPAQLSPFIREQVTTLVELREFLQVGGTRHTELRRYKSASMEILNQCAPYL